MMIRQLTTIFLAFTLSWTTIACDSTPTNPTVSTTGNSDFRQTAERVSNGRYEVQQATYNDADGTYTLQLLNTPAGAPGIFRGRDVQMARLDDEAVARGEKTYAEIDGGRATMYLTEDFKIEYIHNVTETREDPRSGQRETVVVRQESSFWTPFLGAVAGQALGSFLFRPQYYIPPVYTRGAGLTGFGGYGPTYDRAVVGYRQRYTAPPPAVRNQQTLRSTGNLRRYPADTTVKPSRTAPERAKSSGSGYGSSTLKNSGRSNSYRRAPSFGSSGSRRPSRSFGSRRR